MWVLVYLGIALAGLVMVACFAVWLWRKAVALLREAGVLLGLADELAGLLGQIGDVTAAPSTTTYPTVPRRRMAVDLRPDQEDQP